jgi:hypothetical protein
MKTKRFLLAAAIAIAASACTGDATAPESAVRGPAAVPASMSETTVPTLIEPVEEPATDDGSGNIGSGCCPSR